MAVVTTDETPPSLADLTARYRRAQSELEEARQALMKGIRDERAAGTRQADIVRRIDHVWTVEYVRKILKGLV
jgi:hypothetical protein